MATIRSFEEIEAWKAARTLTRKIRAICKQENVKRDYAFVDQITRSVRSIGANIAEGFEASSVAEFVSFLSIAKRSTGETRAHMYDALDEGYVSREEFGVIAADTVSISKMLSSFMAYLRSSEVDSSKRRIRQYRNSVSDQTTKPVNQ